MCWLELTDFVSAFDELSLREGSIIYMILGFPKGSKTHWPKHFIQEVLVG